MTGRGIQAIPNARGIRNIRIIGCGNPERGDDGAGLLVVQGLREPGIEAEEHSGEASSLMELWAGADAVILIDAVSSGKPPGVITVLDASAGPIPISLPRSSTHHWGVAEAVELARALHRLPARLLIYGIEGRCFELGSSPSLEVMKAMSKVVEEICAAMQPTRKVRTPSPNSTQAFPRPARSE